MSLIDLLNDIKNCKIIDIVDTDKNRKTRYLLGITVLEQEDYVRNLTINEYVKGPVADHNGSAGDLWVFKIFKKNTWIYIKVKEIKMSINGTMCKALSCHIDNMV